MSFRDGYMAGLGSGLRPPRVVTYERTNCISDERRVLDLPSGAADQYYRAYRGAMAQNAELRRQLAAARNGVDLAGQRQLIADLRHENAQLREREQAALARVQELEGEQDGGDNQAFRRRVLNHARIALHADRWHNQPRIAAFVEDRFREIEDRIAADDEEAV
jgi:hypothetical protein